MSMRSRNLEESIILSSIWNSESNVFTFCLFCKHIDIIEKSKMNNPHSYRLGILLSYSLLYFEAVSVAFASSTFHLTKAVVRRWMRGRVYDFPFAHILKFSIRCKYKYYSWNIQEFAKLSFDLDKFWRVLPDLSMIGVLVYTRRERICDISWKKRKTVVTLHQI